MRGQQCPAGDRETVAVVYLVDLVAGWNGIQKEIFAMITTLSFVKALENKNVIPFLTVGTGFPFCFISTSLSHHIV